MLLARLGLRAIEVARLELEDPHWRAGEISVCGKGGARDQLPLRPDAGEALAAYLSVRDRRGARRVFVTFRAPTRPITASVVRHVVRGAFKRAGVPPVGAHRLRHTLATELLFEGASLEDIGQVLRHKSVDSTAVYAKVDLTRLRQVARPWPELGR
jgi:integrase